MTDESTPDSKAGHPELTPEGADRKGQMLVIYLPEGSVIVDRTDTNMAGAPKEIVEQVEAKPAPASQIETAVPQPMQPTLQEVVQLAVQEVLQIAGIAQKEAPKVEAVAPAAEEPKPVAERQVPSAEHVAPSSKQSSPVAEKVSASVAQGHVGYGTRQVHVRRRRKVNWVHGINTFLVAYLLIIAIVPAVVASAFGTELYASKLAHPGALIARGDLMVTDKLPTANLQVNDVILVRDGYSWHLDVRVVSAVTTAGSLTTVTTESTGGTAIEKTYVMPSDSGAYKVTRVIPELGYVPIFLSSVIVKVLGGLFILILNVVVHFRRLRRRRLETVVR